MKKHLNKICVFLVIISILCTALFSGCSKKASVSVNESESNSASVSENNKDTAKSGNHKEDSPAIEENSSVLNKETEREKTTKDKYNKESTTKPVGKETTTKVKAKEPTTAAYTPKPLVPLTAEQELKIKQDYLEYFKEVIEMEKATVNDITITKYFGTYKNCVVMFVDSGFGGYISADMITERRIGEYTFVYPNTRPTDVYCDGQFTTLQDAYKKGWLTDEDIRDIHYYHTKFFGLD